VGDYEAPLSGERPAENLSGGREPAEDSRLTPAAQEDNSRLTPAAQGKAAQEERRYDESFDDANPKPVTYKQLVDSIARDKGKPLIDGKWSSPEHQRYILECNARNWLFEDEPMGIVFKTAEAAMKYVLKLVVPMARQLPDGSLEYRYTILGEKWENPFELPTMDDAVYTPEETFTLGAADGLASIAHEAKYKWELQLKGKYPLPPEGWFDDWTCMTDAGTKPRPPVEAAPPPDYPLPKPNMTEQEEREWLLLYLRAHGKDVDESIFDDPPEVQEEKQESAPSPEKPEKKQRTYAQQADYTGKNGFSSKRQKQQPKSPYPPIVWHSLR
jgi:hypothetical protein